MNVRCFSCGLPAQGTSAYCADCAPPSRLRPRTGRWYGCGRCGRVFYGLQQFDRHQVRENGAVLDCLDPAELGLEQADGAWATPEGIASRAQAGQRLKEIRARQ